MGVGLGNVLTLDVLSNLSNPIIYNVDQGTTRTMTLQASVGGVAIGSVFDLYVYKFNAATQTYQQQYLELGSRPLLDVLNAEQEVYQARFTQQQTLGQLHQLQLNCLYNTGRMRHAFSLDNRTIQSVEIQP